MKFSFAKVVAIAALSACAAGAWAASAVSMNVPGSSDGSGRKITQGASLMAMSAFAKAGMPLVERFDTSVSELELKYANNKLIGEDGTDFRKIIAGQVPGSDFYLVGGITELNYNIRSTGADATGGDTDPKGMKGSFRNRTFVMNVAMDLRLVNTRTLEVVDVIPYQKQVVGKEIGVGIFDFLGGNVFDISGGSGALEPMQMAVRSLIERRGYRKAAVALATRQGVIVGLCFYLWAALHYLIASFGITRALAEARAARGESD